MTLDVDSIIDDILEREGQGSPPYLTANDKGHRTSWGISAKAHPDAWRPGPPTKAQARAIYQREYVKPFDALFDVTSGGVLAALIDDAVLSGVTTAIKRLQAVLRVTIDGVIGPQTIAAVEKVPPNRLQQRLVVNRAIRIARLVQSDVSTLSFLTGWITRVLSLLPEVEG